MNFVKTILAILLPLFILPNSVTAQQTFELEGTYLLSSEKLKPNREQFFSNQSHHSFGVNGLITFPNNIFLRSGVQFRQFGTAFQDNEKSGDSNELPMTTWAANRIDVPMNVGYYFLNNNRFRIGASMGLSNGFTLNQTQTTDEGKQTDMDVYQNFIMSFNSSLEIGVQVKDKVFVNVRPTWQRQLNMNFSDFRTYHQVSLGCEIGLSYQIGSIKEKK